MTTTAEHAEQGTRSNRRGQAWQRRCAAYMRARGFPRARHVGQFPGVQWKSDLFHVGPRVIECTVFPWERIGAKLRQAEQAAKNAPCREFWVWKHLGRGQHETGSDDDSVLITRARMLIPLLAELDALRAFASTPMRQAEYSAWRAAWDRRKEEEARP